MFWVALLSLPNTRSALSRKFKTSLDLHATLPPCNMLCRLDYNALVVTSSSTDTMMIALQCNEAGLWLMSRCCMCSCGLPSNWRGHSARSTLRSNEACRPICSTKIKLQHSSAYSFCILLGLLEPRALGINDPPALNVA